MFTMRAKNFDEIYTKLNNYLFFVGPYDHERGGVTAHSFHNQLLLETAECNLNMSDINYTMNKWRMLINLYLDPKELGTMCARLLHYTSQRKHKLYIPDIGMSFKARRNVSGACLMAITVGFNNGKWQAEVFSRASELTMRWYVDLIFVHVLLREIGKVVGFTPSDISVAWRMASSYQSITSMPLFLVMAGKEDWLQDTVLEELPARSWKYYTIKRYRKVYLSDGYMSFKVQRRPAEAYHMLKGTLERKAQVYTADLTLPEINLKQEIDFAETEDTFGKGGYR